MDVALRAARSTTSPRTEVQTREASDPRDKRLISGTGWRSELDTTRRAVSFPHWVKTGKVNESKCFPLFTQQRTSPRYFGMSVRANGLTARAVRALRQAARPVSGWARPV